MINLTIDDKKIEVPEGTTVLRAAESAGIKIPTLCDHKALSPYGGCRLCLVEVEGARTLQPSCTLPVSNNMVVKTDSEKIRSARKFVLTLIFSERNHFCPYCQVSGGDCELQNAALNENMTHWPLQPNWKPYPVDASHPYIVLDHNRCILCRRCVRACGELVGNFTLGFEERGANSFLVADLGVPLGESTCVSCGTCVQICPTGALIERTSAYLGQDKAVDHTFSVCNACSVGCGIDIVTRDNNLLKINGDWDAPVNGGVICEAGRFIPLKETRERILTPMIRKNGALKAATWEDALQFAASALKPSSQNGKNQIAAIISSRTSTETLWLGKQIFSQHLGSKSVGTLDDYSGLFDVSVASETNLPFENRLEALNQADCIIVFNEELREDHEVVGFMVKRAVSTGASLIIISNTSSSLDLIADKVLSIKKGSELDLLKALSSTYLAVINSMVDQNLTTINTLAGKTGITAEQLVSVAKRISSAKAPVAIYGKSLCASKVLLDEWLSFAKITGMIKENQSSLINTRGKANGLAASLMGFNSTLEINNTQVVYVLLGDEEPSQLLIKKLEGAPTLIVQASYASQLTAMADVVLPVGTWAEQGGTFINLEGRIQKAKQALTPPDGVRSNEITLKTLADYLGIVYNEDWKSPLSKAVSPVQLFE